MTGSVEQVFPDLWRLRLPLPGHTIGHVNVYVLGSDDGVLLIDGGWCTVQDELVALLGRIGRSWSDVRGVLFTHLHPDHSGMAARLQATGAWIALHDADARCLSDRYFRYDPYVLLIKEWLADAGAPMKAIEPAVDEVRTHAAHIEEFIPDRLLDDGERVGFGRWDLEVLHTPGHTRGHCCFFDRPTGTLFSGDHVFPTIQASPTYRPHSPDDPVGDYLGTLGRLDELPVDRVLAGHQHPFTALPSRTAALRAYHSSRMDEVAALVGSDVHTVWEIAAGMNRKFPWSKRPWWMRLSAVGETYAHLIHLERQRRIVAVPGPPVVWVPGEE